MTGETAPTYWNHRMTVQTVDGEESWGIRELYYDGDDNVIAWTADPVAPFGEDAAELRADLARMTDVLTKPAFDIDTHEWRGEEPEPSVPAQPELFVPVSASGSGRVECTVCHTRGYPGGSWQGAHRRGHAACPRCGQMLQVRLDGSPRTHTRCPAREAS